MTNTLPKYENYKASGVEWLGEIPEHWESFSNKYIFKLEKKPVGKKSNRYVLLSLTLNGIIKRDMENPQGKFPAEFDTYQEVKKDDFIFCLFDVEETPRTIGLSDFDGMITGAYTVMRVNNHFNKKFLYYFYLNLDADKRMKPLYTGLRNTITKDNFFSFKTFIPPLQEQTAIASFIDQKTAKLDQAIAQKVKLIALLKERRQILIHHAVTKGLDDDRLNFDLNDDRNTMILDESPSKNSLNFEENDDLNTMISNTGQTNQSQSKNHQKSKFRHSGVDWIGEIPEHWEVKALKHIAYLQSGETISAESFTEDGYPVYGGNGFRGFAPSFTNDGEFALIGRQGALCGNVNYAQGKFFASEHAIVVYPLQNENVFWLGESIKRADFNRLSQSAAQPGIAVNVIKNIQFPYPPKNEQIAISNYLTTINQKTSTAINLKEKEIEKLKEYKATLINSAVTGKINVSDYA